MAFLCPSRLGRKKQKKDNFYDLKDKPATNNGTNGYSERLIILQNFTSDDADELSVKQGQKVTFVFREGDWAYVVTGDGKEGFVPFIYCAKLGQSPVASTPSPIKEQHDYIKSAVFQSQLKNLPQSTINNNLNRKLDSFSSKKAYDSDDDDVVSVCSSFSESTSYDTPDAVQAYLKAAPWIKRPDFLDLVGKPGTTNGHICSADPGEKCGDKKDEDMAPPIKCSPSNRDAYSIDLYRVLYNYEGSGQDDICAAADDIVCGLDGDDMFMWVQKEDHTEGYIPKYYLQKIEPDDESPRSVFESPDPSPRLTHNEIKNSKRIPTTPRSVDTQQGGNGTTLNDTKMNTCENNKDTSKETRQNDKCVTKTVPAKPPRLKKPKTNSRVSSHNRPGRQVSNVSESDWDTLSEQTADTDTDEQASLTDSMKFGLLQQELQKLAPLHHRESVTTYTSASSYEEDVFDDSVHQQLDQLQPPSPHKLYKYQREKADYYDEYFYDDSKLEIKDDKNEVINVAEILEIRDSLHRIGSDDTRASSRSKVLPHSNISTNLKQYMLSLPTTVLGYGGTTASQTNTKTGKGTRRYYVSQVEDDESVLYSKPNKVKHKDNQQSNIDIRPTTTATTPTTTTKDDNKQSAPKTVTLKKHDWSFGYPRKTKPNSYSQENIYDSENVRKLSDKSNNSSIDTFNGCDSMGERSESLSAYETHRHLDPSCTHPTNYDMQDPQMQELLDKTDGLLNQSKALLTKKPKYRTANPPQYKDNNDDNIPARNIELTDPTEKCNHYLTNLILNKGNTSIPNSTKSDHEVSDSEFENAIANISKSNDAFNNSLDENDNVKLCHDMVKEQIEPKSPNDFGNFLACDDVRGITEFVVQYDYTPDSDLAIPVVRGEVLHIGLDQQEDTEWYWAYSPRLRAYGYVPRLYVRIPVVTII